jgi:hypothetical protein
MGSDAVNVTIGGVTTIPKGLDVDVPEYGVVYASLFFGNAPETSGVTYQWRVGPDYGTSDILDANHPLVTSGAIKFKSTTAIAANDFTETGGLIAANADGNNFGNQRGLVIYENAVAGSLLLQCTAKITSGSQFEGYKTIVDKNDTYSISMISTAGAALKNGAGSTYIYARVFNGATEIKNLMSWQWRWTMLHSDGSRGAFVSSGETKTITSHTTGSGAVFTLQGVFATLPAIGSIIRVVKNHVIRYYVIAAITNTTNATITISTDPTTSAYDWINKDDHPDPTASEFAGGSLIECWDSYTRVLSFVAGGSFNCIADNSYDVTTGTFTTTASVAGVIAANDVIRLRHPTASNNCRFYQVLSVSGTAVTIKKTGITRRWITPTRYPYPINTDEMNGWYLQKITGVAGLPETGVSVGAQDVDIKSTFVCEVSKP